jgi:hypothetical protein
MDNIRNCGSYIVWVNFYNVNLHEAGTVTVGYDSVTKVALSSEVTSS